MGLLLKSTRICDGGLCMLGFFDSRTTRVSTFSRGSLPAELDVGRGWTDWFPSPVKVENVFDAETVGMGLVSVVELISF